MEGKTKINNRLWQARQKAGLEQKQVAFLLGHKTTDQISRYERGIRTPNLKTALKLEQIYRTRIGLLFPEHFEQFEAEIAAKAAQSQISLAGDNAVIRTKKGDREHSCTHLDLLAQTNPSEEEIELVRQHAIKIHNLLSDVIYQKKHSNEQNSH